LEQEVLYKYLLKKSVNTEETNEIQKEVSSPFLIS
jgi:hypothetical protein